MRLGDDRLYLAEDVPSHRWNGTRGPFACRQIQEMETEWPNEKLTLDKPPRRVPCL